jgi:hypothetical protein
VWTAAARAGGRVQVIVASFVATGGEDRTLDLSVTGLAAGGWRADVFRIDAAHPGATDPDERVDAVADGSGRLRLSLALPAQSVVLAELSPAVGGSGGSGGTPGGEVNGQARGSLAATGRGDAELAALALLLAGALLFPRRGPNPASSPRAGAPAPPRRRLLRRRYWRWTQRATDGTF